MRLAESFYELEGCLWVHDDVVPISATFSPLAFLFIASDHYCVNNSHTNQHYWLFKCYKYKYLFDSPRNYESNCQSRYKLWHTGSSRILISCTSPIISDTKWHRIFYQQSTFEYVLYSTTNSDSSTSDVLCGWTNSSDAYDKSTRKNILHRLCPRINANPTNHAAAEHYGTAQRNSHTLHST
jgi:hypothetical protein